MFLTNLIGVRGKKSLSSRGNPARARHRGTVPALEPVEDRVLLSFTPAISYPVGLEPKAAAVGDFNDDQVADLAVANSGSVSVLLGQGDGTFGSASSYATGGNSVAVSAKDFTSDGVLDLVTVNRFGSASFLRGNGDGTFGASVAFSAGDPWHGTAGDFNGDGRADLVVAAGISVWLVPGNGDGTFGAPAQILPYSAFALAVETGDFNRDDVPDVVVVNSLAMFLTVFLGNGDGTFRVAPPAFTGRVLQARVSVGDFNADGRQDLVSANFNDNTMSVLLGYGDGTFEGPAILPTPARADYVGVGDFNNDGLADLAAASRSEVVVRLSNGDGTFADGGSYAAGAGVTYAAVGDWNADGWNDLAVANEESNNLSVLLNDRKWPGSVAYFYIYPDSGPVTAGAPFDIYVFALDAQFNVITNYAGEVGFYATDPQASTPVYYRFRLADQGIASFPAGLTLRTPGVQELYVFDLATYQVFGYAAYDVLGAGPVGQGGGPWGTQLPLVPDLFTAESLLRGPGNGRQRAVAAAAITP